jgi:tRNA pseudouridine55 synthase
MFGLLNLNKPAGITSRQAVDQVKRLVRPTKIGHAGTLDPLATGVLVIGLGQATRLVEYIQQMPKHYRAAFLLGRTSDTEDIEGRVRLLPEAPRPALIDLQAAAEKLTGEILQRPPAYSALKVLGQRSYDLARAGQQVELAPRTIQIHHIRITRYEYPELTLEIDCGSGTYVRSLGRDLAELVGTGAVMCGLERAAIGPFKIADAVDAQTLTAESIEGSLLPATLAVEGLMPAAAVSPEQARRLMQGLAVDLLPPPSASPCAALDETGRLVAILAMLDNALWKADKFFLTD